MIKDLNNIELTLNKSEIETLVDGFPSNKNRPKNGKFVKQKKGAYFYNCKGRALLSFFRSTVLRYLITIFFRTHIDKKDDSYLKNLKSFHDDTGYINDIFEKDYDGILGMEHGNSIQGTEGEKALVDAYLTVDSF